MHKGREDEPWPGRGFPSTCKMCSEGTDLPLMHFMEKFVIGVGERVM